MLIYRHYSSTQLLLIIHFSTYENWLVKIRKRDYFDCGMQKQALADLEACNKAFTEKVYFE
jgi:hypothetical protein